MSNRNKTLLSILGIVVLTISFISVSYAFFRAHVGEDVTRNVTVTTHTVDTLTFSVSDDISIEATQTNFVNGGSNLTSNTIATALLTPNSKTGSASKNYYLYVLLTNNGINYCTTNTNQDPELMLQVFDTNNQLVTLTGLGTQKTIKGVTGYDITGKSGLITLLNNHSITASNNNATTENYRVVITLINLDINQNENTGKTVTGNIIVRETATTYCALNPTNIGCTASLTYNPNTTNTIALTSGYLYHHDNTLTNGTKDGSYRYAGANPNNYVCFGSDAATCPANNIYRIIGLIPVDVVINESTGVTERQMLYKIIKNDYLTSTESSTGIGMYSSGWHPDSYGGPSDNQYVSNPQGYYWSGSSSNQSNTWSSSTLNTSGLNGSYLTSLGSTWSNKIAKVIWKVGGNTWANIATAIPMSTVYKNEITEPVPTNSQDGKTEYAAKVGMMYVSDYGYAAPQSAWTYPVFESSGNDYRLSTIIANNWLYRGVYEWTVSRFVPSPYDAYIVGPTGYMGYSNVYSSAYSVRPAFYLNSSTTIDMSGTHAGTIADPYRIS